MKANELRIGNLIYYSDKQTTYCVTDITISNIYEGAIAAYPIPLTEEWLLKFGFDQLESGTYICPNQIVLRKDKNGYLYEVFKGKEVLIQHVHSLQNLYFALTSEELEIKKG